MQVSAQIGRDALHLVANPGFTFHFCGQQPPPQLHPSFRSFTAAEDPALPIMSALLRSDKGSELPPYSELPSPANEAPDLCEIAQLICADKAFENTSTSVAASQMRNALNNLADTVEDPEEKKVGLREILQSWQWADAI